MCCDFFVYVSWGWEKDWSALRMWCELIMVDVRPGFGVLLVNNAYGVPSV